MFAFIAQYKVALMHLKRGSPRDGLRVIGVLRVGWPGLGTADDGIVLFLPLRVSSLLLTIGGVACGRWSQRAAAARG